MHSDLIELSDIQVKQIFDRGFTYVMLANDEIIKVTEKDLISKAENIDNFFNKEKLKNDLWRLVRRKHSCQ